MLQEFKGGGMFTVSLSTFCLVFFSSMEKGKESVLMNILLYTRTSIMEIGCSGTSKLLKQVGLVTIQLCGVFLWGCFGGRLLI